MGSKQFTNMKILKIILILLLLFLFASILFIFKEKKEQIFPANILLTQEKLEVEIKDIKDSISQHEIFVVQPTETSEVIVYIDDLSNVRIIQLRKEAEETYINTTFYFVDQKNYYLENFASYQTPTKNIYDELVYNEREKIFVINNKIVEWLYVDHEVVSPSAIQDKEQSLLAEIENMYLISGQLQIDTQLSLESFQSNPLELDAGGCSIGYKDQIGHVFTNDFAVGYINIGGKLERLEQISYLGQVETYSNEYYVLTIKFGDPLEEGYESIEGLANLELESKTSGERLEILDMIYFCGV